MQLYRNSCEHTVADIEVYAMKERTAQHSTSQHSTAHQSTGQDSVVPIRFLFVFFFNQGVLPYYYNAVTEPGRSLKVDRCIYNTMADTPECTYVQTDH